MAWWLSRRVMPVLVGLVAMSTACTGVRPPSPVAQGSGPAEADGHHPQFTTRPPELAHEGWPYFYTFAAQDPAGAALKYELVRAPAGARLEGQVVAWVPQHRQCLTPQGFTLRVVNAQGLSQDQSWTVIGRADLDLSPMQGW